MARADNVVWATLEAKGRELTREAPKNLLDIYEPVGKPPSSGSQEVGFSHVKERSSAACDARPCAPLGQPLLSEALRLYLSQHRNGSQAAFFCQHTTRALQAVFTAMVPAPKCIHPRHGKVCS